MMQQKQSLILRSGVVALALCTLATAARAADKSFIDNFNTVTTVSSTVPSNGDVNPYGVARVPTTKGSLVAGRFLISNFNDSGNFQGTGTTIVQIAADGTFSLFAQIDPTKVNCPGGVGLTTALVALRSGFVIVGSLPTANKGTEFTGAGCLIVLDSNGKVVETISGHHLNGPWDMTAVDGGFLAALFVTNVLNGNVADAGGSIVNHGTVVRLLLAISDGHAPVLFDSTVIASGFPERTDPNALIIGPTGVAFDDDTGNLYVADSLNNRIAAIPNALFRFRSAGIGFTVTQGGKLNDPLGLALAPNHHILTANGDDGNIVETNPFTGKQVAAKLVDNSGSPPGSGALFGLIAVSDGVLFVDDASNTFNLLN
ncbi:hypothetical protein H7849_26365 [Alloacidobacterium dinghuense]|uniref:NHL repeat-containing protein n=1 Tax=Alloacidobacterium dinghuense TaxID=2763107 RepID=A0A7G8BIT0_9BACT|nr:hypothetical protein [Alloacidobacterium dinghuense]QNI32450.1 hypothetical protein H7849_26365 [Alloacidobacterium dinghuense]